MPDPADSEGACYREVQIKPFGCLSAFRSLLPKTTTGRVGRQSQEEPTKITFKNVIFCIDFLKIINHYEKIPTS